jgi:hypothetical protein
MPHGISMKMTLRTLILAMILIPGMTIASCTLPSKCPNNNECRWVNNSGEDVRLTCNELSCDETLEPGKGCDCP